MTEEIRSEEDAREEALVPTSVIDLDVFAKLTPKQQQFLNTFPAYGSITKTAEAVKITTRAVYVWISRSPSFKLIYEQVRTSVVHLMENAAIERSVFGVTEDIFYKGEVCGQKTNYSDALLMFMLRAHKPETYREKSAVDHFMKQGEATTSPLDNLSKDALAEIHKIIAKDADKNRLIIGTTT